MPFNRPLLFGLLLCIAFVVVLAIVNQFLPGDIPERVGTPPSGRLEKSDAEWKDILTAEQFRITRGKGTEHACSGALWNTRGDGVYSCVCCGQSLFDSAAKFDSGTGWPSFFQPVDKEYVTLRTDRGLFTRQTEVLCSRCDAHLGHVFKDGPEPTGLRWCINSAALNFKTR